MRKSVAKETADADGHVNAGPAELPQWNHLHAHQTPVFLLPDGPHPEQGQHFGHIIPVGAHGAGSPDADADGFRIGSRLFLVALKDLAGQLLANLPGGGRRQGARVNRVKVATGGQHVGHAARRRAARSGRNIFTLQATQEIMDFVGRSAQRGHQIIGNEGQDRSRAPPENALSTPCPRTQLRLSGSPGGCYERTWRSFPTLSAIIFRSGGASQFSVLQTPRGSEQQLQQMAANLVEDFYCVGVRDHRAIRQLQKAG